MSGFNRATLIGHLGKDPEIRRLNDGRPVVSMRLATSDTWRDKQTGERREHTEWHNVVIYNEHLCKIAEQYLKKGSKVLIEGKIKTRKWQDQSGVEKWTTEIVLESFGGQILMLSTKSDAERQADDNYIPPSGGGAARPSTGDGAKTLAEELDDEIPF